MKNKFLVTAILVLRLIVFPQDVYALPQLSDIEHGNADFVIDGNTLTITVQTDQFIANYHSFNIAQNETVRFIQPFATSTALNRVISGHSTMITGVLTANGIIFIVNPAGINFGPTAQINTAGLIASTLNISSADFLAQNYVFEGQGAYINVDQGALLTSPGGYIILFSNAIRNMGTIEASLGKVILATGEKITLDLDPNGDISVVINGALTAGVIGPDGEVMENSIENIGTIAADGGKIILTSEVLNGIFDKAINNTGIIEATSLGEAGGEITLLAKGGNIINEGHIAADGSTEAPDGGVIDIEADNILHQGIVSADAQEGGTAGDISIVAKDKLILDNGSLTSAAVSKPALEGEGGNIYLNATEGDTLVRSEAVIDVSAGSEAGDAGFVEVSALEGLGFYGILKGSAAAGYTAARVLFDPRDIIIADIGIAKPQD
ncbi:MAG: filamentous hemagglutinin N-terminal domain-containing protein, partial [Candidatus Omnitrophota bacterium]